MNSSPPRRATSMPWIIATSWNMVCRNDRNFPDSVTRARDRDATMWRQSKCKFQGQLNKPRWNGFHYLPESSGTEVAVDRRRAEELSVIKRVECLQPELQRLAFRQHDVPKKREGVVQGARSIKRPPRC